MNPSLTFIQKTGAQFREIMDELGQLRIAVFREFPYLYEGSMDYEKSYLQTYAKAPRSFLYGVLDGGKLVGATTCLPLTEETEEVQKPFLDTGYDLNRIFYFGESILLPAYRGLGLGHRFFDSREAHARSFGAYDLTCFCAVVRPEDHPLRPADYRPLDAFWAKRGYQKQPQLQSRFEWPDLGTTHSTPKTLVYWTRPLLT